MSLEGLAKNEFADAVSAMDRRLLEVRHHWQ
jgi:hypothetical protein